MPSISAGSNVTVSLVLFVTLNVALFLMNFYFIMSVIYSFMSRSFVIAIPDISSIKGTSKTIHFSSLCFTWTFSFGKNGMDLFRKLKQESHESITPSSSNTFLIPRTRSTFSCISDTNVKISNLCFCIVITTGMTNNTLTYCLLPACILLVVEVNLGIACRLLHLI